MIVNMTSVDGVKDDIECDFYLILLKSHFFNYER